MFTTAAEGERRCFAVVVGLKEGYDEGAREHAIFEVTGFILDWMKRRAAAGRPFVTGAVTQARALYAWPAGPGRSDGISEPVAIFQGELSVIYNREMSDREALDLLVDLASLLGEQLNQTRVYVSYRDAALVLQHGAKATPTGDTV